MALLIDLSVFLMRKKLLLKINNVEGNNRTLWKLVIMLLLLLLRCLNSKTMICLIVYKKETPMYIFVKLNFYFYMESVSWVIRTESSYWIFNWTWTNRKWIVWVLHELLGSVLDLRNHGFSKGWYLWIHLSGFSLKWNGINA